MNELKPIKVKAQTISDALTKAASILGVPTSQIEYKEVKKGMLSSLFSSRIEIIAEAKSGNTSKGNSIWAKDKSRSNKKKNSDKFASPRGRGNVEDQSERSRKNPRTSTEPRRPRKKVEPLAPDQMALVQAELSEYLVTICNSVFGEEVEAKVHLDKVHDQDRINFDVKSKNPLDESIQINGRLLDALEHLVRKKPRHLKQEIPFKVLIDINGFREQRQVHLKEVALDVAEKVSSSNEPMSLKYKSSYDRKVIHMALENDQRVYTKSVGMGSRRKLMVFPSDQA